MQVVPPQCVEKSFSPAPPCLSAPCPATQTPKAACRKKQEVGFFRTFSNNPKQSKLEKAFVLSICMLHTSCPKGKRNCLYFSSGMNTEP